MGIKQLEGNKFIWAMKYRPNKLKDVILPKRIKEHIKNFIEKEGRIPNLLLNGAPGTGKTTLIYAIANELNAESLYINASLQTSVDVVRTDIFQFASSKTLFDNTLKIVILDEADRLSQNAQDSMKSLLETVGNNVIFVYITNHKERIISPLKSRLEVIDFVFTSAELKEMKKAFMKRLVGILKEEGVEYRKENIIKIIKAFFPDMRKCLVEAQKAKDYLNNEDFSLSAENNIEEFIELLKDKSFAKINQYVNTHIDSLDPQRWYVWLENNLKNLVESGMKKELVPWFIITLNDYMYKSAFVIDGRINILAFIMELLSVKGGLFSEK